MSAALAVFQAQMLEFGMELARRWGVPSDRAVATLAELGYGTAPTTVRVPRVVPASAPAAAPAATCGARNITPEKQAEITAAMIEGRAEMDALCRELPPIWQPALRAACAAVRAPNKADSKMGIKLREKASQTMAAAIAATPNPLEHAKHVAYIRDKVRLYDAKHKGYLAKRKETLALAKAIERGEVPVAAAAAKPAPPVVPAAVVVKPAAALPVPPGVRRYTITQAVPAPTFVAPVSAPVPEVVEAAAAAPVVVEAAAAAPEPIAIPEEDDDSELIPFTENGVDYFKNFDEDSKTWFVFVQNGDELQLCGSLNAEGKVELLEA